MLQPTSETIEAAIREMLAHKPGGFHRSANAIHVMRVRQLGVRRRDYPFYSANSLAKLMGIDRHGVMLWIKRGLLEAKRRGTERSANQGGDEWLIRPSHIRR